MDGFILVVRRKLAAMEQLFNFLFLWVENSQHFTNVYLWFQVLFFLCALSIVALKISQEILVMKRVQTHLEKLDKTLSFEELVRRIHDIFQQEEKESKYKQQWRRYFERILQKEDDERIRTEPFFSPEVMIYHMGYRPWMDAGAGVHVSIGVLGTFIGLSAGLAQLNVMDSEALRSGIESLITGMKIAFYSSVLGVFLSITWIVIDRILSKWLETHIDWHAERLDYLLNIDDEEIFLNRLEKVLRQQADHLKTLLTDALEKAMQPVVHVLQEQLDQYKRSGQLITEQLISQVTGGTEQVLAQYIQVVQQTSQMQSSFIQSMDRLAEQLADWEKKQSETAFETERLYVQLQQIGHEFAVMYDHYRQASDTMEQVGATFDTLGQLAAQHIPMQKDLLAEQHALAEKFEQLMERVARVHDGWDQLLHMQTTTLTESERLLKEIQAVSAQLTPLAPVMQETAATMQDVAEQFHQLQAMQNEFLPEIVLMRQETTKAVEDIRQVAQQLSEQNHALVQHWENSAQNFTETRKALDLSLKGFAESIEDGLKKTFDHFDRTLTMAVSHISGTIDDLIDALEELDDFLQRLRSPRGGTA